jgi:hypothetical protein
MNKKILSILTTAVMLGLVSSAFVFFSLISFAFCDTYITGVISVNTTWNKIGSPYIITGNTLIDTGVKLTIEPGVVIKISTGCYIQVRGELNAIGTPNDLIIFTSNNLVPTNVDWEYINFIYGSTCNIQYCSFKYAKCALKFDSYYGVYAKIQNCYFMNCGQGIDISWLSGEGTCTFDILDNIFYKITGYGWGWTINFNDTNGFKEVTINIINNILLGCSGGIQVKGDFTDTVTISSNIITGCYRRMPIYCWDLSNTSQITNNLISNNTVTESDDDNCAGGLCWWGWGTTGADIRNNTIINNRASSTQPLARVVGGVLLEHPRFNLNYNNIWGNTNTGSVNYDLMIGGRGSGVLNATTNYWGTITTNEMDTKGSNANITSFYDYYDDFNLYKIDYSGWVNSPFENTRQQGFILGKVTNTDGSIAISGVVIELLRYGVVVSSTTTDTSGDYMIIVATGTYDVRASVAGYQTQTKTNIVVSAGQTATVNFALIEAVQTGTISGKVTKSDGTTPITGATVAIIRDSEIVNSTTTDTNGNYSIILSAEYFINVSTFTISVSATGYETVTQKVRLQPGEMLTLNFALNTAGATGKPDLFITLFTDTTTYDLGGTVNVTIILKNQGRVAVNKPFYIDFYKHLEQPPVASQVGDKFWLVSSLGVGVEVRYTWSFVMERSVYNMYAQVDADNHIPESDEQNNIFGPVKITESKPGGKITGKVVNQTDGKPIENAVVSVLSNNNVLIKSVNTDIEGRYEVTLPAGSYILQAEKDGFQMKSVPVSVVAGEWQKVSFMLEPKVGYGAISGIITKKDGVTPIPGALVQVITADGLTVVAEMRTTIVGNYRFILETGTYRVRVEATGYKSETRENVVVRDGEATILDIGLELLVIAPEPVADLSATALDNATVMLEWLRSPSANVGYYCIYYSTGQLDYTELFSVVRATVTVSDTSKVYYSWTSPELTRGELYFFSVRPVNVSGIENLDVNKVATARVVEKIYNVRAIIRVPQAGKKVSGERLTVVAELISGVHQDVEKIEFQYKPSHLGSEDWQPIPVPEGSRHTNPDTTWPYFIHWDITSLPNGNYDIRAIAYDKSGGKDPSPLSITITINRKEFELSEEKAEETYTKKEKIYTILPTTVTVGGIEKDDWTRVFVPQGALKSDTEVLEVSHLPNKNFVPPTGMTGIGVVRKVSLPGAVERWMSGARTTIRMKYNDTNNNDIIDETEGTNNPVKIDKVKVYKSIIKPETMSAISMGDTKNVISLVGQQRVNWVLVAGPLASLDRENKEFVITDEASNSYYALFAEEVAPVDLAQVHVYPNPFEPYLGHKTIKFTNLNGNVTIKVYNIAGELVWEKENITQNTYEWDAKNLNSQPIASGIYLYLVTDKNNNRSVGMFTVIR